MPLHFIFVMSVFEPKIQNDLKKQFWKRLWKIENEKK